MLRFLIKYPYKVTDNKSILNYSNLVLSMFKQILQQNVDYIKIKLRCDYLISNNILQFSNQQNVLSDRQIINLIINSFKVNYVQTNNDYYRSSIILPDYIIIPNSNMSLVHFIRFIEYGNFDIQPYHWIRNSWDKVISDLNKKENNL